MKFLLNGSGLCGLQQFAQVYFSEVASTQHYAIYALTLNVEALCGDKFSGRSKK